MEDCLNPPWLTESFLTDVLHSVEGNKQNIKVIKWWCRPAVPLGTNYMGHLYRLSIDYRPSHENRLCSIRLIVKVPLKSGRNKDFIESFNGYGKEVQLYREALPQMYKLGSWRLTAQSFDCSLDNSLVLEDLQAQGYKMADRLRQLDAPHCRQFLISLSRFHGLSVALHHKQPDLIQTIGKETYYTLETIREKRENYLKTFLSATVMTINKLDGCKQYAELISSQIDSYYDKMKNVFSRANLLNVLNHGDAWVNNILFKYNSIGEVVDAKLVDFQMCFFGSFAHDLIYFWWSSANEDVREHHREELFEVYRQNLNQTLKYLECTERLSKEEFDCEMKAYAPLSLDIISTMLTTSMADPDNLAVYDSLTDDCSSKPIDQNSPLFKNHQNKYYMAILPNVLRQVEEFGAFTLSA